VTITEGAVQREGVILRAPVRHAQVGRVNADVVGLPVFRDPFVVLPAGAEVWKTYHSIEYQCRRDDVQLWCGQRRPADAFRPELQCFMPPESDWAGIAQLRGNQYFPAGFIKFIEDARHEDVTPLPSIEAPPMEIRIAFDRWRGNGLSLLASVWVEGSEEGEQAFIADVFDAREGPRGTIISLWGGELLVRRGEDRDSASVEVLSPIHAFDPEIHAQRLRARAVAQVDEELARRAARAARQRN